MTGCSKCSDFTVRFNSNGRLAEPVMFSVHYGFKKASNRHGVIETSNGTVNFKEWSQYTTLPKSGQSQDRDLGDFDFGFIAHPEDPEKMKIYSANHANKSGYEDIAVIKEWDLAKWQAHGVPQTLRP